MVSIEMSPYIKGKKDIFKGLYIHGISENINYRYIHSAVNKQPFSISTYLSCFA